MSPDLRFALRAPWATALLHSHLPLRHHLPWAPPWPVLWPHALHSPDRLFLGSPEASVMLLVVVFPISSPAVCGDRQAGWRSSRSEWGSAWEAQREWPTCLAGAIIKRRSGEIPCPLAVEAFAAHLSYICKYDDKYSK